MVYLSIVDQTSELLGRHRLFLVGLNSLQHPLEFTILTSSICYNLKNRQSMGFSQLTNWVGMIISWVVSEISHGLDVDRMQKSKLLWWRATKPSQKI